VKGIVLDKMGKPLFRGGRILHAHTEDYTIIVPENIKELVEKAKGSEFRAAGVSWREVLTPKRVAAADGAQVLNTTSETIMLPDYSFDPDALEPGDAFKYTLLFDFSTVITTPGTITFRLRWGGVGGTALCTSGAFAPDPTAAGTTLSGMIEYWIVCRAVGTNGSIIAMGRMTLNDFDDASAATIVGNLNMQMIPTSAPAAVGSLDTTTQKALSPTVAFSVSTSTTQLTNHIGILESLN
jgi:hypothetical protein